MTAHIFCSSAVHRRHISKTQSRGHFQPLKCFLRDSTCIILSALKPFLHHFHWSRHADITENIIIWGPFETTFVDCFKLGSAGWLRPPRKFISLLLSSPKRIFGGARTFPGHLGYLNILPTYRSLTGVRPERKWSSQLITFPGSFQRLSGRTAS